jgi:uncharacterized protein (TIGR02118 family)
MVKAVYILYKRPDMDHQEFRRYWKDVHGPIAAKMPGLRKYVQNHVLPGAVPGQQPCDGIAELWFDSPEAMQAGLASPEGAATMADIPNFLDGARSGMIVVEEVQVL